MAPSTFAELQLMAGQELGLSRWVVVDQSMIQQFADCTGDHQWIHVDPVRARRESPLRRTIAHGYLTLSLVGTLGQEIGPFRKTHRPRSTTGSTRSASWRRSSPARGCG